MPTVSGSSMPGVSTFPARPLAREVATAGLLVAAGVVLPVAFHGLGNAAGRVFLPMHLPVALAGLLVGWRAAASIGLATPLLSSLLTGMPPLAPVPVAVAMAAELSSYGATVAALARPGRSPLAALAGGMVAARVAAGLFYAVLAGIFGFDLSPSAAVVGALVTGWPGLVAQLALVPPLAAAVARDRRSHGPASS